jgi:hypothetical protein
MVMQTITCAIFQLDTLTSAYFQAVEYRCIEAQTPPVPW